MRWSWHQCKFSNSKQRGDFCWLDIIRKFLFIFLTQKIVRLDLRSKRIGDQGAKYIADALRKNTVSSICLSFAFDLHSTCRLFENLIYDQTISQKMGQNIYTTHCEITRLVFVHHYFFCSITTFSHRRWRNSISLAIAVRNVMPLKRSFPWKTRRSLKIRLPFLVFSYDNGIKQSRECIILRGKRLGNIGVRYLLGIFRNDTVSLSHDHQ